MPPVLLPEQTLFQIRIGWLRPEPNREEYWAEGGTGNGQLIPAVDSEGRARTRDVGKDHLVTHLDGFERVEQLVNVGLHRLHGVRRIVVEAI